MPQTKAALVSQLQSADIIRTRLFHQLLVEHPLPFVWLTQNPTHGERVLYLGRVAVGHLWFSHNDGEFLVWRWRLTGEDIEHTVGTELAAQHQLEAVVRADLVRFTDIRDYLQGAPPPATHSAP